MIATMQRLGALALLACAVFCSLPARGQTTENGYVLQTEGRLLFIDKGEQDSVRPGDLFQVIRHEVIQHPETGENLAGDVPLGTVRVVEVFPKISTAEVVELVRGVDMKAINTEARQGIIRIRPLPAEEAMSVMQSLQTQQKSVPGMSASGGENPDGRLHQWVPEIGLGFGSRPAQGLPSRAYQLIDPVAPLGDFLAGSGVTAPDSAFAGVATTPLLSLADTAGVSDLGGLGSSLQVHVGMGYPLSTRLTALAQVELGSRSLFAAGARIYPGRLLGFLGEGNTPDGRVGEPAVTLMVGRGGQGATSLSASAVIARSNLTADATYKAAATDTTVADSLYRADVTRILGHAATDSLSALSKRGVGLSLALTLPVSSHFTVTGHLLRVGNIKEIGGGLTYYMRAVEPHSPQANPDGMVHSAVVRLGGRYDSHSKAKLFDLGLTLPMGQAYSLLGDLQTNGSKYTRFGLAFRFYMKGS